VLDGIALVCYVLIHTKTCPAKSTSIGIQNRIKLSLGLDLGSEVLVLDNRSWSCHKGLVEITDKFDNYVCAEVYGVGRSSE